MFDYSTMFAISSDFQLMHEQAMQAYKKGWKELAAVGLRDALKALILDFQEFEYDDLNPDSDEKLAHAITPKSQITIWQWVKANIKDAPEKVLNAAILMDSRSGVNNDTLMDYYEYIVKYIELLDSFHRLQHVHVNTIKCP